MVEVNDGTRTAPDKFVEISNASATIVIVYPDGSVEFGEGFTVEGAARAAAMVFWSMYGANLKDFKDLNK